MDVLIHLGMFALGGGLTYAGLAGYARWRWRKPLTALPEPLNPSGLCNEPHEWHVMGKVAGRVRMKCAHCHAEAWRDEVM